MWAGPPTHAPQLQPCKHSLQVSEGRGRGAGGNSWPYPPGYKRTVGKLRHSLSAMKTQTQSVNYGMYCVVHNQPIPLFHAYFQDASLRVWPSLDCSSLMPLPVAGGAVGGAGRGVAEPLLGGSGLRMGVTTYMPPAEQLVLHGPLDPDTLVCAGGRRGALRDACMRGCGCSPLDLDISCTQCTSCVLSIGCLHEATTRVGCWAPAGSSQAPTRACSLPHPPCWPLRVPSASC